jgi:integrase
VSNVDHVELAAAEGHTVFIAWDEPGKDERRTRVVEAYACAPGETPATPPMSVVERDTWPTTVDEAARRIVAALDKRHTFCSHLAMRGVPARAIQELAGHQDLGTTQRHMHLSPAALDAAIRLLDGADSRGGIVEAPGKLG